MKGKLTYWSLGTTQLFCVWQVLSAHGTRGLYSFLVTVLHGQILKFKGKFDQFPTKKRGEALWLEEEAWILGMDLPVFGW